MADISLHFSSRAPAHRNSLAGTFTAFATVATLFGTWRQRAKERRELTLLDARSLRDLGLTSSNVQYEANKPFWID